MKLCDQDLVHPPDRLEARAGRARADSDAMWADSLARPAHAGWMRSPAPRGPGSPGCWASQSISRSGWSVAQLVGDRDVAPRVAEPDRRGDVERALRPARAARPGRGGRRTASAPPAGGPATSRMQQVDAHRVAGVRSVAAALELDGGAPGSATAVRAGLGRDRRRCPGHQRRASDAPAVLAAASRSRPCRRPVAERASRRRSRAPQPTASSICFVECGSVKHSPKKNSGSRANRAASSGGSPSPSPRRCRAERRRCTRPSVAWAELDGRGDLDEAGDTLGVLRRQDQRLAEVAPRHDERTATQRRQGPQRRPRRTRAGVERRVARPVGAAVAARVERHHGAVPGEVRDLAPPRAGSGGSPMSAGAG